VVIIDSARTQRAPLPVLKRGPLDRGPDVYPSPVPPYPTLLELALPANQPGARVGFGAAAGDVVTLRGHDLAGDGVSLRLSHPLLAAPLVLAPQAGATAAQVQFQLPTDQTGWPAGFWTVAVVVSTAGAPDHSSNVLSFPLVPRVVAGFPAAVALAGGPSVQLDLQVSPQVWPQQRASLLFGGRELRALDHPGKSASLSFTLDALSAGAGFARVRVDGVDTLVVTDYTARPPAFDPSQRVSVTP
jgi:hypothetical protein